MLNLDLGVEQELIVKPIPRVQDGAQEVGLGIRIGRRAALVRICVILDQQLTVTGDGDTPLHSIGGCRGRCQT